MSLPSYPTYRDSGVQWLESVPKHWSVKPLKRVVRSIASGTSVNAFDEPASDGALGVLKTSCVYTGRFDANENKKVVPEDALRVSCPLVQGALIVSRMNTPDLVGAAGFVEVSRPNLFLPDRLWQIAFSDVECKFIYWWTRSANYRAQVEAACTGTSASMKNLAQEQFTSFVMAFPPRHEQVAVAKFLDRETAAIDVLVAEQQRLIELLQEKRQAIVSHAVTKGLNPDASMKPSGNEWIGNVPAHWDVIKMKWVAQMESGHTPDKKVAEYWEAGEIPWVSLNDTGFLKDNDYITHTAYYTTPAGVANSSARLLPAGAVVFSRDATIGRCAITARSMTVSQHFIAWVCGERIVAEYLLLRLRSMTQELERLMTGATVKTIGMPDVRTLVTPLPPVSEQQEIVQVVTGATQDVDRLASDARQAISLLNERKSALISAAVTGKIDVRSFAESQLA